jgi:hypothetical protein
VDPTLIVAVMVAVEHDPVDQVLVSFASVWRRSMRTDEDGWPKSRTVMTFAEPRRPDLESCGGQEPLTTGWRAAE